MIFFKAMGAYHVFCSLFVGQSRVSHLRSGTFTDIINLIVSSLFSHSALSTSPVRGTLGLLDWFSQSVSFSFISVTFFTLFLTPLMNIFWLHSSYNILVFCCLNVHFP
jgi:hypothetical protein